MITFGRWSHAGRDTQCYFEANVKVGNFTAIADNVTFCGIMNYPCVNDRLQVNAFPFGTELNGDYRQGESRGKITVGNDVWIGHKAIILDGVTIGDGAIVGLGAIVGSDVAPYSVVVGNPARVSRMRFTPEQIKKLLEIAWWEWDDDTVRSRSSDFKDVDSFIKKYERT